MPKSKIPLVHSALLAIEVAAGASTFPGMLRGEFIVYVPEWNDGMMLWGDLWVIQFGPLLVASGSMRRFRLFLSPAKAAQWVAAV